MYKPHRRKDGPSRGDVARKKGITKEDGRNARITTPLAERALRAPSAESVTHVSCADYRGEETFR